MKKLLLLSCMVLCSLVMNAESKNGIVYVKTGGTGDGSTWELAMGNIQDAINKAKEMDDTRKDVWVAGGNYALTAPILMIDSVSVYGGFAGNESGIADRQKVVGGKEWEFINETVLDGDNKTRLIEAKAHFDQETFIDGLTLTKGNGTGTVFNNNAGALVLRGNITLQNCIIKGNTTTGNGGGMNINGGNVRNCHIFDNQAALGGGIYSSPAANKPATIEHCLIETNVATGNNGAAGIRVQGAEHTYCNGLVIRNNSSVNGSTLKPAGGISTNGGNLTDIKYHFYNCAVYNNSGTNAIYVNGGELINCTVTNNVGGIYLASPTAPEKIINTVVWGCENNGSATGITGAANANCEVKYCATYNDIPADKNYALEGNIKLSSNNSNGDVSNPVEGTVGSGARFKKVTTFKGIATNSDQLEEIEMANWALNNNSPLIDMGMPVAEVTTDIIGTTRPFGEKYDMGAYEYSTDPGPVNIISGSTDVNQFIVYANGKEVSIENAQGIIEIYDLTGKLVQKENRNNFTIAQKGLYILKSGKATQKVVIR